MFLNLFGMPGLYKIYCFQYNITKNLMLDKGQRIASKRYINVFIFEVKGWKTKVDGLGKMTTQKVVAKKAMFGGYSIRYING
jgi:hypothetical protein